MIRLSVSALLCVSLWHSTRVVVQGFVPALMIRDATLLLPGEPSAQHHHHHHHHRGPSRIQRPVAGREPLASSSLFFGRGGVPGSSATPTCLSAVPPNMIVVPDWTNAPLWTFFLQTLIATGVPALVTALVLAFAASLLRGKNRRGRGGKYDNDDDPEVFDDPNSPVAALYNDLYGDQAAASQKERRLLSRLFLGGGGGRGGSGGRRGRDTDNPLPTNVGVPGQEFLKLTHLNRQYDSYQFSLTSATQSRAAAASQYRQSSLQRALHKSLWNLTLPEWQELQELEQDLLHKSTRLYADWRDATQQVTEIRLDYALQLLGLESVYQLDPNPTSGDDDPTVGNATGVAMVQNVTVGTGGGFGGYPHKPTERTAAAVSKATASLRSQASKLEKELAALEWEFIGQVLRIAGPSRAASVRTALLGDASTRGTIPGRLVLELQERPLTAVLNDADPNSNGGRPRKPVLYVCRFPGDTTASQVDSLREEVTAITRAAQSGDEALVILQTGGGTVTGYGLAASQLARLKAKLRLTVAVEQVAASGGYMMCCVADKIVASPFAVLGSIGVISDIPNVYERLKKEGIEFQTVTAGKYKRTLTPTKKVTKDDYDKTKADIEDVYTLFRNFVAENRPQLNIDEVATGETWFGKDALERQLCDEIKPVDDVLTEYVDAGFDVFEVEYSPPPEESSPLSQLFPRGTTTSMTWPSSVGGSDDRGWVRNAVRWMVRTVASEVQAEFGAAAAAAMSEPPLEQRFVAQSDRADQVRTES